MSDRKIVEIDIGDIDDAEIVEVEAIEKKRVSSYFVEPQFEEYKMYEASDGELFSTKTSAKKYNDALNRKIEFCNMFSIKHGNLKRGQKSLALTASEKMPLTDYFWVRVDSQEQMKFLRHFFSSHYKIAKTTFDEHTKNFIEKTWLFFVVYDLRGNYNKKYTAMKMVNEESIQNRIASIQQHMLELESFLPSEGSSVVEETIISPLNSMEAQAAKGFNKIDLD